MNTMQHRLHRALMSYTTITTMTAARIATLPPHQEAAITADEKG